MTEFRRVYMYLIFDFDHFDLERKTTIWSCFNTDGEKLGSVSWFDRWNQYVFKDEVNAFYSASCISDIADFLRQLNEIQNKAKAPTGPA